MSNLGNKVILSVMVGGELFTFAGEDGGGEALSLASVASRFESLADSRGVGVVRSFGAIDGNSAAAAARFSSSSLPLSSTTRKEDF